MLTRKAANPKTLTMVAQMAIPMQNCAPLGLLPLKRPGLACAEDTTLTQGECRRFNTYKPPLANYGKINTYKKPGGGGRRRSSAKFLDLQLKTYNLKLTP